jgi:hypothetical protein
MKEYYKKENNVDVYLHVVGGGEITEELKKRALDLKDKVRFYGFLFGEELDDMYDRCDIGLEILAPGRKDIKVSASLKSREYIARGFPFVSACNLDISILQVLEEIQGMFGTGTIHIDGSVSAISTFVPLLDRRKFIMNTCSTRPNGSLTLNLTSLGEMSLDSAFDSGPERCSTQSATQLGGSGNANIRIIHKCIVGQFATSLECPNPSLFVTMSP